MEWNGIDGPSISIAFLSQRIHLINADNDFLNNMAKIRTTTSNYDVELQY